MSKKDIRIPMVFIIVLFIAFSVILVAIKFLPIYKPHNPINYQKDSLNTSEFIKNILLNSDYDSNNSISRLEFLNLSGAIIDLETLKVEKSFGNVNGEFLTIEHYKNNIKSALEKNEPFFYKKILPMDLVEIFYAEKISPSQAIYFEKNIPLVLNGIFTKEFFQWISTNILFDLILSFIFALIGIIILSKLQFIGIKFSNFQKDKTYHMNRFLEMKNIALKKKLYLDDVTNLPNKHRLEEDIKGYKFPKVIIISIDDFTGIIDCYGDDVSNRVLVEVSKLAKEFAMQNGFGIYSFRGDKFVLAEDSEMETMDRYETIADELIRLFKGYTIHLKDNDDELWIEICCSAGFCLDQEEPIKKALIALKRAKIEHKDLLCYFKHMDESAEYEKRKKYSYIIEQAIVHNQVVPYFQPIFDKYRNIIKYEALVRIVNKEDGVILPGAFLKDSKRLKRYVQISKTLIEKCFIYAKNDENLTISVNMGIGDMIDGDLSVFIIEKLNELQVAKRVVFEILEDEDMRDSERVKGFIDRVRRMGSKVAIDDFGSGYSNFSYILRIRPDYLKIDGSIIKNLDKDQDSFVITSAIVAFAQSLGIKTIAEFVHSQDVFSKCIEIGIDEFQGFYLGEPKEKFVN